MEARYNIYFAGQLLDGHDLTDVRARMAKLFNANEATLDKLFSGKNQLVKRDCDRATALKYKKAIEGAGAVPLIKALPVEPVKASEPEADQPLTAAQKIAALAAAADKQQAPSPQPAKAMAQAPVSEQGPGDLQLAPEGTAVLLPEEQQAPAQSTVNTPDLDIDTTGQRLSEAPPPAPPPPDTSHLSEGQVGEVLPVLREQQAALSPDTSGIELSPDGTDLSDCAPPLAEDPHLDLSAIELAPAGSDVLEPVYRRKDDTPPPATEHLKLED